MNEVYKSSNDTVSIFKQVETKKKDLGYSRPYFSHITEPSLHLSFFFPQKKKHLTLALSVVCSYVVCIESEMARQLFRK